MSMEYVRKTYGVPAKRGMRVIIQKEDGTQQLGRIMRATHHIYIKLDGEKKSKVFHPTDDRLFYPSIPPMEKGETQ